MRLIASLIYVAAAAVAASRAVAINRSIEIIDLAIGVGRGDEIKHLDFNGVIHEKELQFFCLETQDLTLAPFRARCFTRYISRNMDIVKDVGDVTYAVASPLPKMTPDAVLDRPLVLELTYISTDYSEFWTANIEIEADAFFFEGYRDEPSLLLYKPDPFEYVKVLNGPA